MPLKTNSANWIEKSTLSKAATTGQGRGVAVKFSATSGGGTRATVRFPQGHTLDSAASGSVDPKTAVIAPKKIDPRAKTTYGHTFTKAGYSPATSIQDVMPVVVPGAREGWQRRLHRAHRGRTRDRPSP